MNAGHIWRIGKNFVLRNSTKILLGVNIAGTILTAWSARDAGIKAYVIKQELMEEYKDQPIPKDVIAKRVGPVYIRTFILGGLTIASAVLGHFVNDKEKALLSGMVATAQTALKNERERTIQIAGENKANEIATSVSEQYVEKYPGGVDALFDNTNVYDTGTGTELYLEPFSGQVFRASPEHVRGAFLNFNERLLGEFELTMNDLYYELNIPERDCGRAAKFDSMHTAKYFIKRIDDDKRGRAMHMIYYVNQPILCTRYGGE